MKLALLGGSLGAAVSLWAAVHAATTFESIVEHLTRSTGVGQATELGAHARWNSDCEAEAAPTITLEQPPVHGNVCLAEDAVRLITSRSGAAKNCVGRSVRGVKVIYLPHAAFSGTDALRYRLDVPEGRVRRDISIVVQAGRQTADPLTDTVASATRQQQSGPMPECPRPVS